MRLERLERDEESDLNSVRGDSDDRRAQHEYERMLADHYCRELARLARSGKRRFVYRGADVSHQVGEVVHQHDAKKSA